MIKPNLRFFIHTLNFFSKENLTIQWYVELCMGEEVGYNLKLVVVWQPFGESLHLDIHQGFHRLEYCLNSIS